MSASPSRSVPSGFPMPSVERLTAHFDNISLGSPSPPSFVGEFKGFSEHRTAFGRTAWEDKPLPAVPSKSSARSTSDPTVPASLRPGYGHGPGAYQPRPQLDLFTESFPQPPNTNLAVSVLPMPTPTVDHSLTMEYARFAPPTVNNYSLMRQPNNEQATPKIRHQHASSTSILAATPSPIIMRTRASSSPPSPVSATGSTSSNTVIQCSGITKAGKRCTRVVKAPPPLSFFAPTSNEPVQRFCFQHVKEIIAQSGFYSHKQGIGWVEFADWIPDYLHADTQAALRVEMEKPASKADVSGYIYAYEIRDDREPNELQLKVGRAVELVKRLDQWSKQCTSKEVILRGWWPGRVEDDDGTNGNSLLRGKIVAGEKGPFCHRLERLVHLELADLAVHVQYLEPGFPKTINKHKYTKDSGTSSAPSTPGRLPKSSKVRMPMKQPCRDCGAMHKEIFTFQKASTGEYKNMEWERLVMPVIARWGTFVGQYV